MTAGSVQMYVPGLQPTTWVIPGCMRGASVLPGWLSCGGWQKQLCPDWAKCTNRTDDEWKACHGCHMGQYDAIRTLRSVTRSLKQPTNVSGGAVVIISGSGAHFHREMVDGKSTNKVVHAWSSSKRFSSWARVADTDPVPELCELAAGSPDCVGTRPASEQNVTTRSGDESRYQLATATAAREMRLLNDRSPFHLGMMIETPPEHFPEVQPPWQPPLQLPTASSTSERSWAGLLHRANPEAGTFERYTLSVALWVQAVLNASLQGLHWVHDSHALRVE